MSNTVIYAIGDVHGEADRLRRLHRSIFDRHAFEYNGFDIKIIHLGDYVDRGPDSCGAISAIIDLETSTDHTVISLRGNHEQMMLDAMDRATPSAYETWCRHGGDDTLSSYRKQGHVTLPSKHLNWVRALPTIHIEQEAGLIFVHGGIDVDEYPGGSEVVHLWTRSLDFFNSDLWSNPALNGLRVVHGHTPTEDFFPEIDGQNARRINLDTGAVFGGRLTAAIFAPDQDIKFIYA